MMTKAWGARAAAVLITACALTACESAKEQLGIDRSPPDEFAVMKRAPLEMPPEFTLRPPQPGMPRPQEQAPTDQARTTIFGGNAQTQASAPMAKGEAALLQQAAPGGIDPNIRRRVDSEVAEIEAEDKRPVAQRLIGWTGMAGGSKTGDAPATIVDPAKETQRIRTNAQTGQPVTAGETPTIED